MATQETQQLDNIIASRRALLMGGGALALAALVPSKAKAASTVTTYSDADILNFALNLEYLEANFYFLAAFGTTIDKPNAASMAAGQTAAIGLTGTGTQGVVSAKANPAVPFTLATVKAYAIETALEEGRHVSFLRSALGGAAVAQPTIDLTGGTSYPATAAWNTLVTAAKIGPTFDPFASDANFLVGAYVFEDVGVTAYKGAAPLISTTTMGKAYLAAAASILAVEAYHAGLVRTTINAVDPTNSAGYQTLTQQVSALRTQLSQAAVASGVTPVTDDYGLNTTTYSLEGSSVSATQLVDADQTNVIAFSRTTTQVLNIVTGGNATKAGTKSQGVFYPSGMNGTFS